MNTNPLPNTLFKGRSPSWTKNYPVKFKKLLMSISKKKVC